MDVILETMPDILYALVIGVSISVCMIVIVCLITKILVELFYWLYNNN